MKKHQFKGIALLFIAAFVWGSSFVAQAEGMELVEAFTFNSIRMLLGSAVLLPFILGNEMRAKKRPAYDAAARKKTVLKSVKSGLVIGCFLFVASTFQQFSFNYSTPGKIAFVTAFYMFLVPVFGLAFGRKPSAVVWASVVLGIAGLYILCIGPAGITGVNRGDILAFACAVCYSFHIISIEKLGGGTDGLILSSVQFFVTGAVSCVLMFIFEKPDIAVIRECMIPIAYSGVMSCGVAFTFQVLGQRDTEPAIASLIMCLESVFGVLSECVFYRKLPSAWEATGCAVMFAAIILSQTPGLREYAKRKKAPPAA